MTRVLLVILIALAAAVLTFQVRSAVHPVQVRVYACTTEGAGCHPVTTIDRKDAP